MSANRMTIEESIRSQTSKVLLLKLSVTVNGSPYISAQAVIVLEDGNRVRLTAKRDRHSKFWVEIGEALEENADQFKIMSATDDEVIFVNSDSIVDLEEFLAIRSIESIFT